MTQMMAVPTPYFDEFFTEATDAGIRQAVILAAGLDARAYRLRWPVGTTVYEIDQPQVVDFKTTALATLGAAPTTDRRTAAVDLRDDWPPALRRAGLEPNQPIAWSAERLLQYLPPDAQDRLLDNITDLSTVGSHMAMEKIPSSDEVTVLEPAIASAADRWQRYGFELDASDLCYGGPRPDVAEYRDSRGPTNDVYDRGRIARHH
jgi:methyltransferase (TIGR00027 family)